MGDYLLVNDVHLADRPPSSCTETYLDDLFALLAAIGDIARERAAAAVIYAGDVFHIKTPGRTAHSTVRRFIDHLRALPCPTMIVPGNHDLLHDRLESIAESQPLGVVFASGAATELRGWHGEHPVYGVPWLRRFSDDWVTAAFNDWRITCPGGRPKLVVTHAPLYPPGQELKWEHYPATKWAAAMANRGTVHYGHVHEPHGVYTVDGVAFSNPGALSRGSLHEHTRTRPVQIACWNSETGDTIHLDLPHRPATDVLRVTEAAAEKAETADLAAFLAAVGTTRLDVTSTEATIAHIRAAGYEPDLTRLLCELLTEETAP